DPGCLPGRLPFSHLLGETAMRYLLGCAGLLAVGAFLVWGRPGAGDEEAPPLVIPEYGWEEIRAIWDEGERLDAQGHAAGRFSATLEKAKADLLAGGASLAEVADGVTAAARRDKPGFLKRVQGRYPALSPRASVALTLLGHLRGELRAKVIP